MYEDASYSGVEAADENTKTCRPNNRMSQRKETKRRRGEDIEPGRRKPTREVTRRRGNRSNDGKEICQTEDKSVHKCTLSFSLKTQRN